MRMFEGKQFSDIEKLAISQGIYKVIAQNVDTKNPDSLRGRIDAQMIQDYKRDGIRTKDIRVCGHDVGTLSIKRQSGKPATEDELRAYPAVEDVEKFERWINGAMDMNRSMLIDFIICYSDDFLDWWMPIVGELPDGCEIVHKLIPGQPAVDERIIGTVLKIDENKVADALKGELPFAVAKLLEAGE